MKQYKVEYADMADGKNYDDILDLVNVNDIKDCIMAAPDNFTVGEVISEDEIEFHSRNYIDGNGYFGSGTFAFKKSKK